MRICHLADSHLGAGENHPRRGKSGLTLRQEDIINSFVEAIDRIIELKPDICLHAGDIFHSVRPLNSIMAIAGEQLFRLAEENGIPTVIIAGNHDAPKQPFVGAALDVYRRIDNLYVASSGDLETFRIGRAQVWAVPHCLTPEHLQNALASCDPKGDSRFNILVVHGVAAGMPEFSMADLREQEIPIKIMNRFDYTALGHFHNYCPVAPRAYYAGSTERLSQSERTSAKGFLEVTMDPFNVRFQEVTSRDMVDLAEVDASGKRGDELAGIIREKIRSVDSTDKIVRLKVKSVSPETLKTIPSDVLAELKENSFSLDIRFEKEKGEEADRQFGRSSIGRLDHGFIEYLNSVDLSGFDRERLEREALRYLSAED